MVCTLVSHHITSHHIHYIFSKQPPRRPAQGGTGGRSSPSAAALFSLSVSLSPRRHRSRPPEVYAAREDSGGGAIFAPLPSPGGRGRAWRWRVSPRGRLWRRRRTLEAWIWCPRDRIRRPWCRICGGGGSSAWCSPWAARRGSRRELGGAGAGEGMLQRLEGPPGVRWRLDVGREGRIDSNGGGCQGWRRRSVTTSSCGGVTRAVESGSAPHIPGWRGWRPTQLCGCCVQPAR